jgi:hypothetical protein
MLKLLHFLHHYTSHFRHSHQWNISSISCIFFNSFFLLQNWTLSWPA